MCDCYFLEIFICHVVLYSQGDRGQVVSDMVSGDRCHILEQFVELLKIWHQWGCYGNDVFILHNMFGVYRLPFRA